MVIVEPLFYQKTTAFKERVQFLNKINEIIEKINNGEIGISETEVREIITTELSNYYTKEEIENNYATIEEVTTEFNNKQDKINVIAPLNLENNELSLADFKIIEPSEYLSCVEYESYKIIMIKEVMIQIKYKVSNSAPYSVINNIYLPKGLIIHNNTENDKIGLSCQNDNGIMNLYLSLKNVFKSFSSSSPSVQLTYTDVSITTNSGVATIQSVEKTTTVLCKGVNDAIVDKELRLFVRD